MSRCPCNEGDLRGLVSCLAPPRGEWEVHIDLRSGGIGVINNEGIFLRVLHHGEALPFLETIDRPIDVETLLRRSGLTIKDLLCITVKGLREAAAMGSLYAKTRIQQCRGLIERIEKECGGG